MSLRAGSVTVMLGGCPVADAVSFNVRRGELLVLAGPNGAGKTTLLRAIGCLLPFSGTVTFDGASLAAMTARERARVLAYLPQGHVAHWPVTAREAVAIGRVPHLSSFGGLTPADEAAIGAALAAVEAEHLCWRRITDISGGERARVMLARALAAETPVLLADEPTASLDPAHQIAVMALLKRIAGEGRAVIAVIHDLVLAQRFADIVLVMDRGKVVACGPPAEALSADIMRKVFGVESVAVARDDAPPVLAPWHTV